MHFIFQGIKCSYFSFDRFNFYSLFNQKNICVTEDVMSVRVNTEYLSIQLTVIPNIITRQ